MSSMESDSELYKFIEDAYSAKYVVVDTEGNGKDVRDPASGAVTMGTTLTYRDFERKIKSYYFAFQHMIGDNQPQFFEPVCELIKKHPCLISHNSKHDIGAVELWNIFRKHGWYCTMIMQHQINENLNSYGLDALCRHHGIPGKEKSKAMEGVIKTLGWGHVPVYMMRPYGIQDGIAGLLLFEKIFPEFSAQELDGEYWHKEESWIHTISKMEKVGIRVDSELCEREISKGTAKMAKNIANLGGRNPNSSNDLKTLLLDELKLPVVKVSKKTGKPSFDKEAMKKYEPMLKKMGSPVAQNIIEYRGWQKVVSTNHKPYLKLQGKDGRIHPNYKIHGTKTGRLSCGSDSDGKLEVDSPNLQNIPRASEKEWDGNLKQAFVSEDGYTLWDIDYGQIEMRVSAAYAGDPVLLEIFHSDAHLFKSMAEELGWEYNRVKTFVYATNYNAQDERIADIFGIPLNEASHMRAEFNSKFKQLVRFKNHVASKAKRSLYVKYWTGRRRHFVTAREAGHLSFNSLIQGGSAEIIKHAAVEIAEEIDWDTCRLLLQVHDNLVPEIKIGYEDKWLPIITKIMENVPEPLGSRVPFKVEVKKWGT